MVWSWRAGPARSPRPCSASVQVPTSGRDGRGERLDPGRQPLAEDRLRLGPGQALGGEELDRAPGRELLLDEELPEQGGVPGRLAELLAAGRDGGHGAADAAHCVGAPAVGLPVAGEVVRGRRRAGRFACGRAAGVGRPGRRRSAAGGRTGAGPGEMAAAESPAGLAEAAGQPGQVSAVRQAPVTCGTWPAGEARSGGGALGPASAPGRPGRRAGRSGTPRWRRSAARPHQGQVPSGCCQRNSRQGLQSPLSSPVRSPQSRHAPVTRRDLASQPGSGPTTAARPACRSRGRPRPSPRRASCSARTGRRTRPAAPRRRQGR